MKTSQNNFQILRPKWKPVQDELEHKCKKTGEIYNFQMEIFCNYYIDFQDSYFLEFFFFQGKRDIKLLLQ